MTARIPSRPSPSRSRATQITLLALLAALFCAAPASAFAPPTLYVRLGHANSIDHTPAGPWIPLATAPRLDWLGGYEIGYALQAAPGPNNIQHAALQVTGVPDGHPTQPLNSPYCSGKPGTVGTIVPVGVEIQFEGVGVYTVKVGLGPASGGQSDCLTPGPTTASSTGSFTVAVGVAPAVIGSPLIFRAKFPAGNPFFGVRAAAPPGGDADTRCARDATVRPDGSLAGALLSPAAGDNATPQVREADFVRPGAWTCVARGIVEGEDDSFNTLIFGTPWSAPLRLDVRSDFRRVHGRITKPRSKHPLLTFTAEFPEAALGATGRLKLRRLARCRHRRPVYASAGTYKGRFDARGRARFKIRRGPAAYYLGTLSFPGTRFYTKSVDPSSVLLAVSIKHSLSFVSPLAFPQCPF